MDTILGAEKDKMGLNKGFVIGIVVGAVLIAGAIGALYFFSGGSMEDQRAKILEGSFREGSPVFDSVTKDIIISTDDRTVESPTGFGYISMFIVGRIRNKGDKTINALEVNVSVVDTFNRVIKEKRVLVVPGQVERLHPNETIPITLSMEGFDKKDDRANIRWKVTAIRTDP